MAQHCPKSPSSSSDPLCTFGIIADVQYGDLEEKYNFHKTRLRNYRKSLDLLERAVTNWTADGVDCVLQLGDIIDGFNKPQKASESALSSVIDVLNVFPGPVYHTWGNHELCNFTQEELMKSVLFSGSMPQCACPEGKSYYSFNLHRKLKVVVLNCYEISMLGLPEDSAEYKQANELILKHNPNKSLCNPDGLDGTRRRFVKLNGLVSDSQLEWLKETLQRATEEQENVIIMGHVPICEQSADGMFLCLNYTEIMATISTYNTCVLCYFAGHYHEGGSHVDSSGILHVTFAGIIESQEMDAYATAYLYNDRLVIQGKGSYSSYETKLKFPCNNV
ncbi:manganese-dependent ADP-ribose/CDP-alcohol diphosphatase-like [Mizuhopecten yessoensis]|uniref:Manganese-dependent ADP-ribose/CDP-alcohol diphosphatase n=1 Tax=Mizuhopecten yessoensis TaxID=6573 RepID=A0A210QSZ3_MIZYE|nr:manganese-dependent ADP-ribose/CDP-alcohol diphosphatase-like [Mizuhopecten yessoensis]OWF51856.1 Manganese-dependent ADP-ribose/CDP-alcohol diphosphatase [Mizuhopecten yessoensis]